MASSYGNGRKVIFSYDDGRTVTFTDITDDEAKGMSSFYSSLGLGMVIGVVLLYVMSTEDIAYYGSANLLTVPTLALLSFFGLISLLTTPFRYCAAHFLMVATIYFLLSYMDGQLLQGWGSIVVTCTIATVGTIISFGCLWPYVGKIWIIFLALSSIVYPITAAFLVMTSKTLYWEMLSPIMVPLGILGVLLIFTGWVIIGIPMNISRERLRFASQVGGF